MPMTCGRKASGSGLKRARWLTTTWVCLGLWCVGLCSTAWADPMTTLTPSATPNGGTFVVEQTATVNLSATVNDPKPNIEALILTEKWKWEIIGNVQHQAPGSSTLTMPM